MTEAPSVPEEDVNPPSAGVPMLETRGLARRFATHRGPGRTRCGRRSWSRTRCWSGSGSHRPRELSVADARRLKFARAPALRPRLLLLDEVMAGLRGSEVEPSPAVIHALRGEGRTIVVVEHVMKAILSIGRPHDLLSD